MNQARKKVLYLITKATWGGAQRYVYDLASHLPEDHFEPVLAYGLGGKLVEMSEAAKIRTIHLPSLDRDVSFLSDIRSFLQIYRCVRAESPDVLHLNSSKAAALGALAARLAGVRDIVFTVHGWPFGEKRNVLARAFIWKISWFTALLSHHVICVSEYDLMLAKRMPFVSRKAVRIYNGIDLSVPFGSGELIRSAFPPGAKITGTVGELTKNKNQAALIEEARNDRSMYVAIVGAGEDEGALRRLIAAYSLSDRVKLFGFLPAYDVLKGFDTFSLPSLKEGLPYVLLEARAAGLPVVAHRVGGVGEILDAPDLSTFSLDRMVGATTVLYRS